MEKRILNVDSFALDINEYDENTINDFIGNYFAILSEKLGAPLKFKYTKTKKGYSYSIERQCVYQLTGNVVIDVDCALITGLSTDDFRAHPLIPNKKPMVLCMAWYDGFYTPCQELEGLYKRLIGYSEDCAIPQDVSIVATDTFIKVEVEY